MRLRLAASATLTNTLAAIAGTTASAPASADSDPPELPSCTLSAASESAAASVAPRPSPPFTYSADPPVPSATQLWSGEGGSGQVSGGEESIEVVMDSDKVVTATFTECSEADGFRFFLPCIAGLILFLLLGPGHA